MKSYRVAVLPGDGIGPEVTTQAVRVLDTVGECTGVRFEKTHYPHGADHYLATGEAFPQEVIDEMRGYDAILLGAIGDPRIEVGMLERAIIAGIRFQLDLFINLRPIKLFDAKLCPLKDKGPEHVNMVVIRENTEDLYTGMGGFFKKGTPDEIAVQEMLLTRRGADRLFKYAFDLAMKRGKKLTMVDKANAVRAFDLWTRAFEEIGQDYPEVERDHAYVDAACMWMVKNPEWFDTVVTSNVFGDIITDLGAMIQGGMGLAASGNIHPGKVSMFEPIHGSAPKYAGQNTANPLAAILAAQMMLDFLGEEASAAAVEGAVSSSLVEGEIPSASARNGLGTDDMGDIVCRRVRESLS